MLADKSSSEATFDRLVTAEFDSLKQLAPEIVEFDYGWAALDPSLPLIWAANFVAIDDPEASPQVVAEFTDEILGSRGMEHRQIYVCHTDQEAGTNLVSSLASNDEAWEVGAEIYMPLTDEPTKHAETSGRQVDGSELIEARTDLIVDRNGELATPEVIRQLLEFEERFPDHLWFAAGDPPDGFCQLLRHPGDIGQIETVGTMRRSRGRGLATGAILAAVAHSKSRGDGTIYVVATADDWPQHLYARLGFEASGTLASATMKPPSERKTPGRDERDRA